MLAEFNGGLPPFLLPLPFSFQIFSDRPLGTKNCVGPGVGDFLHLSPWCPSWERQMDQPITWWERSLNNDVYIVLKDILDNHAPAWAPGKDFWAVPEDVNSKTRSQRTTDNAISFLELKMHEEITCISQLIKRSTIHSRGGLMSITCLRKMCLSLNFCKSTPTRGPGSVCRLNHVHWLSHLSV